jgi:hypothetical protein
MRTIFLFVGALGLLVGCGDAGTNTGGDAGADASVTCRAPSGCFALSTPLGWDPPRCDYACESGRVVCVPIADGGVVYPGDLRPASGIPLAQIAGNPYSANLQTDQANCGRCGNRCPAAAQFCVRGVCSHTPN